MQRVMNISGFVLEGENYQVASLREKLPTYLYMYLYMYVYVHSAL